MLISKYIKWAKDTAEPFVEIRDFRIKPASYSGNLSGSTVYFCCHNLHEQRESLESDWTKDPIRLPGEFLSQGEVFDKYGNKSVFNRQWNLELDDDQDEILNPDGAEYVGTTLGTGWKFRIKGRIQPVKGIIAPTVTSPAAFESIETIQYTEQSKSASNPVSETVRVRWFAVRCKDRVSDGGSEKTYAVISLRNGLMCQRFSNPTRYLLRENQSVGFHTGTATAWNQLWTSGLTYTPVSKEFCDRWNSDYEFRLSQVENCSLPNLPDINLVGTRPKMVTNTWGDLEGMTLPELNYERLYSDFNQYAAMVEYHFNDYDRSDVCQEIMDAINHFKGNMIAYVKDLPSLGGSIASVIGLVKDVKNPKQWASTFLSLRFADRLTIADTSELIAAMRKDVQTAMKDLVVYRAGSSRSNSGQNLLFSWETKSRLTATIALSGGLLGDMENLLAAPFRWDLLPTLENVWDMVPFSFVVDWFYDVQSIFNLLDQVEEIQLLDVKTQYQSTRYETSIPLRDLGVDLDGRLTRIWYDRSPAKVTLWLRLRAFSDYWQTSVRPVNYLDGAALLVQSL